MLTVHDHAQSIQRSRRGLLSLFGLFWVLLPAGASAHDHRPPNATMRVHGQVQEGELWAWEWTAPSRLDRLAAQRRPDGCNGSNNGGYNSPMAPLSVGAGEHVVEFEFHKRQRPERIKIFGFSGIEDGILTGDAQQIPVDLTKRRVNGRRWWVTSAPLLVTASIYFDVFGEWEDYDGCPAPQYASWTFHLAP